MCAMADTTDSDPQAHQRRLLAARKRIALIAHGLDGLVAIPGTRFRFGIDSLIGLIPGIGDFAGMLMGGTILAEGLRLGAPNALVARMLTNTVIDGVVGSVPVVGDLFDFAFRSNSMNARLLLAHLDQQLPASTRPVRRGPLIFLVLLVPVAMFALAVYGMVALFQHWVH
jgi:hypothetical protein